MQSRASLVKFAIVDNCGYVDNRDVYKATSSRNLAQQYYPTRRLYPPQGRAWQVGCEAILIGWRDKG